MSRLYSTTNIHICLFIYLFQSAGDALHAESLTDKILCQCELLRLSVTNMAEAYTSAGSTPTGKGKQGILMGQCKKDVTPGC